MTARSPAPTAGRGRSSGADPKQIAIGHATMDTRRGRRRSDGPARGEPSAENCHPPLDGRHEHIYLRLLACLVCCAVLPRTRGSFDHFDQKTSRRKANAYRIRNRLPETPRSLPHCLCQLRASAPSSTTITTHPSTDPTQHPKRHPNPVNRFTTLHFPDRQTDRHTN